MPLLQQRKDAEAVGERVIAPLRFPPWRALDLGLFLALLLLYALLPTRNYYWDGISFAQAIEDARGLSPALLHPNHLLFNVLGWLAYQGARGFGEPRALSVLQALSMLCGAAAATWFFRLLQASGVTRYVSLCCALLLALSATWWRFATDANAYVMTVFVLLLAYSAALSVARLSGAAVRVGLLHAAAMALHQLAVLFYPVAIACLWHRWRGQRSGTPLWKLLAAYTLCSVGTIAGLYLAGFVWRQGGWDTQAFAAWLVSHSTDSAFSFRLLSNSSDTLLSYARLFVGGRPALLREINPALAYAAYAVVLAVAVLFLSRVWQSRAAIRCLFSRQDGDQQQRLAFVWLAVYAVFLFFWLPRNTFYKLFLLPPVVLWFAVQVDRCHAQQTVSRRVLAWGVGLVACANLAFVVYPYSTVQAQPVLAFAYRMQPEWADGPTVLYHTFTTDNWLIRYWNPTTVWVPAASLEPAALDGLLQQARARRLPVWLDGSLLEQLERGPEHNRAWLTLHTDPQGGRVFQDERHHIRFLRLR